MRFAELKIGALEELYSLRILIAMKELGPSARQTVYDSVSLSRNTMMQRINELIKLGLVEETVRSQHPFIKTIQLSPLGQRIAERLEEIEEELDRQR